MWFDPLAWTSDGLNSGPRIIFTSQQLLFIAVSLFANLIIITYHLTNPPHPKFSFSLQSRLCIRTHVFSGVIGVVLPLYVFFSTHEQAATICMWVYSFIDFIFAISVAMQAPNVYGVRRLTVSMYFTAVFFKFVLIACLWWSLSSSASTYKERVTWLWLSWVVHQTYAWARLWYKIFTDLDVLWAHNYTICVFLAGFMCVGAVFGFHLFVVWLVAMAIHQWWIQRQLAVITQDPNHPANITAAKEIALLWHEAQANIFRSSDTSLALAATKLCHELHIDPLHPHVVQRTPLALQAKLLFHSIDTDRSGKISKQELEMFFMSFGVTSVTSIALSMVYRADANGDFYVDEQEFEAFFAPFYRYAFVGLTNLIRQANQPQSLRNQATRLAHKARLLSLQQQQSHHKNSTVRVCPFVQPSQLPPPSWVVEEDSPLLEDNDCILHPNGEDMGNPASGSGCTNGVKAAGGAKIAPTEYDAAAC
eukprot:gene14268-10199_t